VTLGLVWIAAPAAVFLIAAGISAGSLMLSLLIPLDPEPGRETVLTRPVAAPAE
jgi:hypothetical protein